MPLIRELDPSAGPLEFFGAELRRWRSRTGLSQEQLGQRVGFVGSQVGKVETGDRAPSRTFAERCDQVFPDADGLFLRMYRLARRWDGGHPSWFTQWLEVERQATALGSWEPLVIPGLLQTPDYARALFEAWRHANGDEDLDQLVQARMERQAIFDRARPPSFWAVIDETVLYRRIGDAKVMWEQLGRLVAMADRPKTTIQIVPAEVGAHVGLQGAFAIASSDGAPGTVYVEAPDEGQTTERASVVARVSEIFDVLRAEGLSRVASRDLIRRVAEERWI